MRIGIIREGKTPPDRRVPLTPAQCADLLERFPYIELVVQPSAVRRITDAEYVDAGVELSEDMTGCDVLFGVKEVPVDQLIPDKTYFFFSHTFKLHPYNAKLLACLDKRSAGRLRIAQASRRPPHHRLRPLCGHRGPVPSTAARSTHLRPARAIDCADRADGGHLSKVALPPPPRSPSRDTAASATAPGKSWKP